MHKVIYIIIKGEYMAVWHNKSKRKSTGGLLRMNRKHRKYELGQEPVKTKVDKEEKKKIIRTRGGHTKVKLRSSGTINIIVNNKHEKAKIIKVLENEANPHFIKHNIITKGAILETDKGKVKVTSRPGQDGVLNGIIVK